jgi:hypothetical protein
VFDGNFNTPWISKPTRTHGALQTITLHFDSAVKFGLVGFVSGAQTKDHVTIKKYARPKTVRIFFFDAKGKRIVGSSQKCSLNDSTGSTGLQKCGSVNLDNVKTIKVRVLSVYGKLGRNQSVAIGEIEPQSRS